MWRDGELEDEDMPQWTRKVIGNVPNQVLVSPTISCGRARTSSDMWQEKHKDEKLSFSHTFVSIVRLS